MAGVTRGTGLSARWAQLSNRLAAWSAAGLARPATGFVSQPEPRSIGMYARGRQLIAGNFLFSGQLIEAPDLGPDRGLWDIIPPTGGFSDEAHGFAWLDDLAAVGDAAARARAQDWTWGWIARFGTGRGPGWTPDLTGRRLIRWINHALLLLNGAERQQTLAFYRSLSVQTVFLSRRWRAAAPGLARFEALTGLIYAGLALTGMEARVGPAVAALARECGAEIDGEGGIRTRNPEELLEVFTLLSWTAQALGEAGRAVPPEQMAAIARIAPTLRALRHADGSLARFHGGGRGMDGRLDAALAGSGNKAFPDGRFTMGFARLSGGRTTVIIDAAAPPSGIAGAQAHASTLAFELTSGRRPVIVSCGSGAPFGHDWHRAGRATASHSTLAIEGYSSSRLSVGPQEVLTDLARVTTAQHIAGGRHTGADMSAGDLRPAAIEGSGIVLAHDGWAQTHGLIHSRRLWLSADGRKLLGREGLLATTREQQIRFDEVMNRTQLQGLRYALRFHLHPDVDAEIDLGGTAVSLALKSGEIWVFRHESPLALTLEPSVYLEKGRLRPRAARQIVLGGVLQDFEAQIGWTLAKAQDTPLAIRDIQTG